MPKRIDWEAVEKDYRTGRFSLSELAEKHNCSRSGISTRAKAKGWVKDLTRQINERTKAKAAQKATGKKADDEIVEAAAEANAEIIHRHITHITNWQDRTERYAKLIDDAMEPNEDLDAPPPSIAAIGKSISSGTQALQRLIQLERQARNMDDEEGDEQGQTLKELLAKVSD